MGHTHVGITESPVGTGYLYKLRPIRMAMWGSTRKLVRDEKLFAAGLNSISNGNRQGKLTERISTSTYLWWWEPSEAKLWSWWTSAVITILYLVIALPLSVLCLSCQTPAELDPHQGKSEEEEKAEELSYSRQGCPGLVTGSKNCKTSRSFDFWP